MRYLSKGIEIPDNDVQDGLVPKLPGSADSGGTQRSALLKEVMRISSSDLPPPGAYIRVFYQRHWFYIDQSDLVSKQSLALLETGRAAGGRHTADQDNPDPTDFALSGRSTRVEVPCDDECDAAANCFDASARLFLVRAQNSRAIDRNSLGASRCRARLWLAMLRGSSTHTPRHWVRGAGLVSNGCFYEGVCQAPLNSDVQWFNGLSPLAAVSLSMIRLQLVVDPSLCILRFKVGVYRAPEPVARSNFYPCRRQAGHHIPHTRKALGPSPGYQRAPSLRTVACKQPAAVSGALTFNAHDASFSAMGNNVLCITRRWL